MHPGVFRENCLGAFSGHCIVCSITFFILDFSVDVMVNMSWILGIEISHKNKRTKEKLKFPKAAHCHSCFCVVVNFFFLFLLLLLFLVSAFFSEEESDIAQEIFFGVLCFSPYK